MFQQLFMQQFILWESLKYGLFVIGRVSVQVGGFELKCFLFDFNVN